MSKLAIAHVYRLSGLSGSEKNILFVLAIMHDELLGFTQMTAPQIARRSCLSENCVRRTLASLEEAKAIQVEKTKSQKGNKYVLTGLLKKSDNTEELERMFGEFWELYPKKKQKPAAMKAFTKINPDEDIHEKILTGLRLIIQHEWDDKDKQYIPYPSTYLNQRMYEDPIEEKPQTGGFVL